MIEMTTSVLLSAVFLCGVVLFLIIYMVVKK
jgi:hypothetical protein